MKNRSAKAGSERDIVVELATTRGAAIGIGDRGLARGRARAGAHASAAALAAEHPHLVGNDLGRVPVLADSFVLPFARAVFPLDVDLRALAQVFRGDFGEAAEHGDGVPLGALRLLAGR